MMTLEKGSGGRACKMNTNIDASQSMDALYRSLQTYIDAGKTIDTVFASFPTGFPDKINSLFQGYLAGTNTWDELVEQSKAFWSEARAK